MENSPNNAQMKQDSRRTPNHSHARTRPQSDICKGVTRGGNFSIHVDRSKDGEFGHNYTLKDVKDANVHSKRYNDTEVTVPPNRCPFIQGISEFGSPSAYDLCGPPPPYQSFKEAQVKEPL